MRKIRIAIEWIAMILGITCFIMAAAAKSREGFVAMGVGCQLVLIVLRRMGKRKEE